MVYEGNGRREETRRLVKKTYTIDNNNVMKEIIDNEA